MIIIFSPLRAGHCLVAPAVVFKPGCQIYNSTGYCTYEWSPLVQNVPRFLLRITPPSTRDPSILLAHLSHLPHLHQKRRRRSALYA